MKVGDFQRREEGSLKQVHGVFIFCMYVHTYVLYGVQVYC